MVQTPPIPQAHPDPFKNGIRHPQLWLWDSWCGEIDETLHLFTLAISRFDRDGSPIEPSQRNEFSFHVRHFTSTDKGTTWTDRGPHLQPSLDRGSYFGQSVWSGSVLQISNGEVLMGFTGIKALGPDRNFFQSMGIAQLDKDGCLVEADSQPFSCPDRDYDAIRGAGYYLGPRGALGANDGEGGGPIMAWRDPFFVEETPDLIHAYWSAKVSAREGCIAHAILKRTENRFEIDQLLEPIRLPNGEIYTQTEVPKIYAERDGSTHLMLISSCDRLFEGQPDSEVSKRLRLYLGDSARGPWRPYHPTGSQMTNDDQLFGASAATCDFATQSISLIAPMSETAASIDRLTIAPIQTFSYGADALPE